MAHVLVYLQRTPQGLHPGSAVALCLARDIGTEQGATVTALCSGDAGGRDAGIVRAAGRFGADIILFSGPHGMEHLQQRLQPVHVLAPWTPEGLAAMQGLPGGHATPRWLDDPSRVPASSDAITGVIPGTLPWYDLDTKLEPEYEGDVGDVPLAPWVKREIATTPVFCAIPEGPLRCVIPADTDPAVHGPVRALGAETVTHDYAGSHSEGTLLWLDAGPNGLPDELSRRDPAARVILLPGAMADFHASWALADWVIPGHWPDALRELQGGLWRTELA